MELTDALAQAKRAYDVELEMMATRAAVTKRRGRLRKLSRNVAFADLPEEARDEIEWWYGIMGKSPPNDVAGTAAALDYLTGKGGMLNVGAGARGYAAARAAGWILLDWLAERGDPVTAQKFGSSGDVTRIDGNVYRPSYAVEFLAAQLAAIDPSLEVEHPERPDSSVALDAAYTVVQAWRSAQPDTPA